MAACFRGEGLYPRRCELTIQAEGLFAPKRDVEIVAGETREVEVVMLPGVTVPLELRAPMRADWRRAEVRILDESGGTVWTWSVRNAIGYVWPMHRTATLALGEYTLEAESDHGMRARVVFGLRDLHAEVEPIVVTLRR
jgi:hypothetical protein